MYSPSTPCDVMWCDVVLATASIRNSRQRACLPTVSPCSWVWSRSSAFSSSPTSTSAEGRWLAKRSSASSCCQNDTTLCLFIACHSRLYEASGIIHLWRITENKRPDVRPNATQSDAHTPCPRKKTKPKCLCYIFCKSRLILIRFGTKCLNRRLSHSGKRFPPHLNNVSTTGKGLLYAKNFNGEKIIKSTNCYFFTLMFAEILC